MPNESEPMSQTNASHVAIWRFLVCRPSSVRQARQAVRWGPMALPCPTTRARGGGRWGGLGCCLWPRGPRALAPHSLCRLEVRRDGGCLLGLRLLRQEPLGRLANSLEKMVGQSIARVSAWLHPGCRLFGQHDIKEGPRIQMLMRCERRRMHD